MFHGSCLCGKITYSVDSEPLTFGHCHCRTCRKAHSSAFSTVMSVPKTAFKWESGEENLSYFESSPGKNRYFCRNCGSQLIADRPARNDVIVRVGSIDTKLNKRPTAHIWRSDGASWYDPEDKLPGLPEGVP